VELFAAVGIVAQVARAVVAVLAVEVPVAPIKVGVGAVPDIVLFIVAGEAELVPRVGRVIGIGRLVIGRSVEECSRGDPWGPSPSVGALALVWQSVQ
jgi:hypothetical protein